MTGDSTPRTYSIATLGCQMNAHDSERMAGLLEEAGYVRSQDGLRDSDVVVLNTCAVRENAATKLYGTLGLLASAKQERPGMQIAVGGCLAQKDRGAILSTAPWVDVVFGTHTIGALPALLERARHTQEAQLEIEEALVTFPSALPVRRDCLASALVSISVGCTNTCTFCIVPSVRGQERDRPPEEILREVQALVLSGAIEVTYLGQNVNAYGIGFGDPEAFPRLLRASGDVEGLERVRFTSPHPAAFTDDVVEAMVETPNVMPSLHMPLQSGSDRILKAMRRSYRVERFLGILAKVRTAIPDAAITTDVIVGFPGETEEDFEETLRVVEESRFASAFTFQYSPRLGTPAATFDGQVPKEAVQERFSRLLDLQERISLEQNQALVGRPLDILVLEGLGRKDEERAQASSRIRVSGRAPDNRLVHFSVPGSGPIPRPGDIATVTVTHGAPHHLLAESEAGYRVRRTHAGDAWEGKQ